MSDWRRLVSSCGERKIGGGEHRSLDDLVQDASCLLEGGNGVVDHVQEFDEFT
jgi:hypothetical protein